MDGDDGISSDDAVGGGGGLPPFQWVNGGAYSGSESEKETETTTPTQNKHVDLVQELSQLTIDDNERENSDLPSVVHRIASPFPCHRLCSSEANGAENEEHPDNGSVEARNGCISCNIIDMRRKNNAVQHYMGTMAQCRGAGGDALREAGAVSALLGILWGLAVPLPMQNGCLSIALLPEITSESVSNLAEIQFDLDSLCDNHRHLRNNDDPSYEGTVMTELNTAALDLAMSCLGSTRDLSCGSALNRAAVLAWTPPSSQLFGTQCIGNGVHVLSAYVERYDQLSWEGILSLKERAFDTINNTADTIHSITYTERGRKELRLLTNALGAIRNTSHSTPDVCQEFFNHGLVVILVWRLMPDGSSENSQSTTVSISTSSSSLPDSSRPWREACFRSAGSLINLAEKCPDAAHHLGSNRRLIYLLIEAWGGANAIVLNPNKKSNKTKGLPLLHLGLAAILNAAGSGALEGGLDDVMLQVLEREKMRKRAAQQREEERKRQQAKLLNY